MMPQTKLLLGKIAVVTGCSQGIGKATAIGTLPFLHKAELKGSLRKERSGPRSSSSWQLDAKRH
jgi:hypothetical protein